MKMLSFILLFSLPLYARQVILISDIDATIKKSDVFDSTHLLEQYYNAEDFKPYAFIRTIYQELITHYQNQGDTVEVHYLTAAPDVEWAHSEKWIKKHNFPLGPIHYKTTWGDVFNTRAYKQAKAKEILARHSADPDLTVYFFGDNHEYDAEAFAAAMGTLSGTQRGYLFIRDIWLYTLYRGPGMNSPMPHQSHLFLSERDLYGRPGLEFLNPAFLSEIAEAVETDGTLALFPQFQQNYLVERMQKEEEVSERAARARARALLENYLSLQH